MDYLQEAEGIAWGLMSLLGSRVNQGLWVQVAALNLLTLALRLRLALRLALRLTLHSTNPFFPGGGSYL